MPRNASADSYRWLSTARWYLWEGGFLLIGRAQGEVPAHAHHAVQVVVALEGTVAIRGAGGPWRRCGGLVVRPDALHSFDCSGALGAMLFVDPESNEGTWLRSSLLEEIAIVPDARLTSSVGALRTFVERPLEGLAVESLIRQLVQALSPGAPPMRRMDPRVTAVLSGVHASDDLRISLPAAADKACLSASRFAHLFRQQMGLPFSRYMLWRKLTRAMVLIGSGETIAAAAHAADFADAAHLTRTFYQMVGMAPSALMRGEFAQIPSPFTSAAPGAPVVFSATQ